MQKTVKRITVAFIVLIAILAALLAVYVLPSVSSQAPSNVGNVRLNVETYLAGKNQVTHPSVYTFDEPWHGYKYWMAYSPYPEANGEEENPCVAVSNDLYKWEAPKFLANPIADNEDTGCDELKDPHILYRDDLDRLEIWYLGRISQNLGGDNDSLLIMRKYSADGVNWSDYEVMSEMKSLSPTVIWDEGKYKMWSIGYGLFDSDGMVFYSESNDGKLWSNPVNCSVGGKKENIDIWHGSVTKSDGIYHMSFIDNSDKQEVLYCTSADGISFGELEIVVENNNYWRNLYRPFMWWNGNEFVCIYGVINDANQWYLSMSKGENAQSLRGIKAYENDKMVQLTDFVQNEHTISYQVKKVYHTVESHFHIELIALAVLEFLVLLILSKFRTSKYFSISAVVINLAASLFLTRSELLSPNVYTILCALISVLILNLLIDSFVFTVQFAFDKNKE